LERNKEFEHSDLKKEIEKVKQAHTEAIEYGENISSQLGAKH